MKLYPSITDRRQDSWKGNLDFQKKLRTGTWKDLDRPAGSLSVSGKKKKGKWPLCVRASGQNGGKGLSCEGC